MADDAGLWQRFRRRFSEMRQAPAPANDSNLVDAGGYDASELSSEEDSFDRLRNAEQVFDLLTETPSEWSVRVGLTGEWGSGKTTVANWVIKRAQSAGHVVVSITPWSAGSADELWASLAAKLYDALKSKGIDLPTLEKGKAWLNTRSVQPYLSTAGGVIEATAPKIFSTLYNAAGTLVSPFIQLTSSDVEAIASRLGEKRIIVLVDDLDRTDPRLIPKTLLTLRDILDKARFSFLLPFDEAVIRRSLADYNQAWGESSAFLDKILDFRISLPDPTVKQRWNLFARELAQHCNFVLAHEIKEIETHLPANPRRIKSIARQFRIFKKEAIRHRHDEIDWLSISFSLLLKSYSEEVFNKLVGCPSLKDRRPFWQLSLRTRDEKKPDEAVENDARRIIKDAHSAGFKWTEEIVSIVLAWRPHLNLYIFEKSRYSVNLLNASETVTWAEYDAVYNAWAEDPLKVCDTIKELAFSNDANLDQIYINIIDAMFFAYASIAHLSIETFTPDDYSEKIHQARQCLAFQYFILFDTPLILRIRTDFVDDISKKLLKQASELSEAIFNEEDQIIRQSEYDILKNYISANIEGSRSFIRRLKDIAKDPLPFANNLHVIRSLLCDVSIDTTSDLWQPMLKEGGIQKLFPDTVYNDEKRALLDGSSEIWLPAGASEMDRVLDLAAINPIVQRNAYELFVLISAIKKSPGPVSMDVMQDWMENPRVLERLWEAALAVPVQGRRLAAICVYRQELEKAGATARMEDPPWISDKMRRIIHGLRQTE